MRPLETGASSFNLFAHFAILHSAKGKENEKVVSICIYMLLTSCTITRYAHLYPIDDVSMANGVLEAKFMAHGTGHGEVEIVMPDGELLKGEFSIVRGGSVGFGNIFATVYGKGGSASASTLGTSYNVEGASPGMASAFGNKGTSMQCEFYNDNWSGHGYGACKSSKENFYRLQY